MTALLEARQLRKTFRRWGVSVRAVEDASLAIAPGEALALVGASGSGKSTLARLLVRLLDADGGTLLWEGRDVTQARGAARRALWRGVQMIFQSPEGSFDPRYTLGESLAETARLRGAGRKEAEEAAAAMLRRCGLSTDLLRRYPREVSGGQCQRAAAARALLSRPKLLLCDEATSALDVTAAADLIDLLSRLQEEEGLAVLFISHDLGAAAALCRRGLVMDRGRIAEEAPMKELLRSPRSEAARRLAEAYV